MLCKRGRLLIKKQEYLGTSAEQKYKRWITTPKHLNDILDDDLEMTHDFAEKAK